MSLTPTKQPIMPRIKRETIRKLLAKGERIDGRSFDEFRSIQAFLNPIPKAEGSALVKLGNTIVMTGVKIEVGTPFPDRPEEGVLQVNAEFVPLASPTFEPGPPDEFAIEAARVVDRNLREPRAVRLEDLVIIPGKKVWIVFNDIYLLDHGGNVIDAGMLSTMLALNTARVPSITGIEGDNVVIDKMVKDKKLGLNLNVVTVSIGIIGDYLLVDPSLEEELVLDSKITIGFDDRGRITGIQRTGMHGIPSGKLNEIVELASRKAEELHGLIREALNNPSNYSKTLAEIMRSEG